MAKTPRPVDTGVGIGQILLGKYRVEEMLGQGGMGIVARCTHLALNEQVAIKMLRHDILTDDEAVSRFMREAQAAVKLRSEYVARVSDVGTFEDGVPYMVMEYLDGQDLGVLIDQQGHVPVQWGTDLMLQTCEALAEAHSLNIVHRDVKPTNLFVTWRPDGTSLIKVLDFGISKSPMGTDMQLTQTQSLLGTPAYMSPEQMRSARLVDQRTDIWSLGTVMYELLEGRRPFEAESFSEMCVKVAVDEPAPMVNTPPALRAVVLRCLAKSPDQRYANMAELGRDLIPFARDPHAAQMMVERMFRLVGRTSAASSAAWDGNNSGLTRAPVPIRDFKSGPVQVEPGTFREKSAPAVLPLDIAPRRRRSGIVIGVVAIAALAIAAGVLVLNGRSATKPTPAPVAQPAPSQPAPAPAPAPAPPTAIADTPATDTPVVVPPPTVDDPIAPVKPATAVTVKKPDKPKPKKPSIKKPVEVKVEEVPAPVPTPPPPVKKTPVDLYSKPRPDQK